MFGIYLALSAVLTVFLDNFMNIFKESYSFWLVPLLILGFTLGFIILHIAAALIMILTVNISKPPRGTKLFRWLIKGGLPFILWFARVKIKADGLEKLPQDGRMLFVCNHQHDFDPVIIYNCFPDSEIAFIGKKDIYTEMPFIAKAMHLLNCLPIDRENDREAAKTIIKAIKMIKDDEASIALFPEGYVSRSCELLDFRNGSLKIALKSKASIVVCVINGTREIPKNMFRRRSVVEFRLLDIITADTYAEMNTTELGNIIHSQMADALKEMRGE